MDYKDEIKVASHHYKIDENELANVWAKYGIVIASILRRKLVNMQISHFQPRSMGEDFIAFGRELDAFDENMELIFNAHCDGTNGFYH